MQLRKNQTYSLSPADFQVVCELAKVAYVKVLSSQVCIMADSRTGIGFRDHVSECAGFQIPSNWVLEWMSGDEKTVSATFGIKNAAPENQGSPAN